MVLKIMKIKTLLSFHKYKNKKYNKNKYLKFIKLINIKKDGKER